jgi:hypothetical protein
VKRPGKKVYSGVYPYFFEKIVGRKGMFERDQNQTNSSFFPMKFKDFATTTKTEFTPQRRGRGGSGKNVIIQ